MAKFREKAAIIDAVQITDEWFDGDHPNPLHPIGMLIDPLKRCVFIDAVHKLKPAVVGDWIITEADGNQYPCKPKMFAAVYELVIDTTNKPKHI